MHSGPEPKHTPIRELVAARAAKDPTRSAFIEGSGARSVSWGAIARLAEELGRNLPMDGERRVGLALDGTTQFCTTYLAALACGLCVAPLDPRATQAEIRGQVAELGLTDLLLDAPTAGLAGALFGTGADVWCVDTQGPPVILHRASVRAAHPLYSLRRDSLRRDSLRPSVILRSSGSTGRPKLIPLTQAQLMHGANQVVGHHRLVHNDRGYCPLPLFHINAQVVGILSTLVSGASMVVDRRLARDRFWDTVEGSGATWLNLVPAILSVVSEPRAARDVNTLDLSHRVRFARSASSPLAEPIRRRFEEATGISVLETYGMTEAAGQITANPLAGGDRRPGSVGLPVGVQLRVVDEEGAEVDPPGQVGEVQVAGPSVISAYLAPGGANEVIGARTPDGWLPTGDLARRDSDGYVYLLGRTDDLINRGGEKLYPSEIEAVLLGDPRVVAASAVGRPHPSLGSEPVAFVVSRPDPLDPGGGGAEERARLVEDLHQACSAALSFYKRPVEITVTDHLPVGATGKVQRSGVRDLVAVAAR